MAPAVNTTRTTVSTHPRMAATGRAPKRRDARARRYKLGAKMAKGYQSAAILVGSGDVPAQWFDVSVIPSP